MFKNGTRWLAAALMVGFMALPAQALDRGVYQIEGTTDYYFVDEFGSRHMINDYEQSRPRWFSDMPINTVQEATVIDLPAGDVVTATIGPDMVVKKTTTRTTTDDTGEATTTTKTVETETVR